jgi:hypothetical protein
MSQSSLARFRKVVPGWVQFSAAFVFIAALLCGLYLIFATGAADAHIHRTKSGHDLSAAGFAGMMLLFSFFIAIWLLALGYVHGDAKRRGMPATLWTLIVLVTPNLIGFLFYFAMRKPLLAPCSNCGNSITPDQRFCSNCGAAQSFSGGAGSAGTPSAPASSAPLTPGPGLALKSYTATAQSLSPATVSATTAVVPQTFGLSLKSFSVGFSVWTGIFLSKSLFAYLKHDRLDSAVLFAFSLIGASLVLLAVKNPTASR